MQKYGFFGIIDFIFEEKSQMTIKKRKKPLNLKQKINRPEVRELVAAIYDYMGSYEFSPRDDIRMEDLNVLLGSIREA